MKTCLITGTLIFITAVQAAAGSPLFQQFAGCVGRMSAEMEHAWLLNDPAADAIAAQRLTFLSLLDATMPAGHERDALAARIDAKMAQATLLTAATFGTSSDRVTHARNRAAWHVRVCREMLLDG